jgi:RNase P subunit RPR2
MKYDQYDVETGPTDDDFCPRCHTYLSVVRSYEDADADGRRGRWVTFVECPNCEWTPADEYGTLW